MRVFIFGAGYSGRAIARALAPAALRIAGTVRSPAGFEAMREAGIVPFAFGGTALEAAIRSELGKATHIVMSIPPAACDPVLALVDGGLRDIAPAVEWIGYLSTVGVYGDHGGAWVDEETPCRPVAQRSVLRLDAEAHWQALGAEENIPTAILRLSGIYGPGRNPFRSLRNGTARRLVKPGQVFNRIHVADIAGAAAFLAERRLGGIWNVTDDEPAPAPDPVTFAARLMGVVPPEVEAFAEAEMTPMARSFYGENKRVSNTRIKHAGYCFQYPDYRMALRRMWESGEW